MASNVNLRTAVSLVAELAKDVGVREDGVYRDRWENITQKFAHIIDLAGKAKATALEEGDANPDAVIADAYYYMGHAYLFRRELKESQTQFEKSLQAHASPDAKYFLGVVLEQTGQQQAAKEVFKKVIEEFPESERAVEANKQLLKPASSAGCFVATACFGSYDAPEVRLLRTFRDFHMSRSRFGRACISLYYKVGPCAAGVLERHTWLKKRVRRMLLQPLIHALSRHYAGLRDERIARPDKGRD
jgi:tetratricopeptide (TPR) repeat protein